MWWSLPSTRSSNGWRRWACRRRVRVRVRVRVSVRVRANPNPNPNLPQEAALREYVDKAARTSDLDRTIAKTKTGVFTGVDVKHPLTGEQAPTYISPRSPLDLP